MDITLDHQMHASRRSPLRITLALLALSLGLGGCASSGAGKRQSVFPPGGRACAPVPGNALMKLAPGESCLAHVVARQRLSPALLRVEGCEAYVVTVPPNQYWDDWGRASRPPHGEDGSFFMNLFKRFKRVPDAQWFALIGTAVDTGPLDPDRPPPAHFSQDLSHRPVLHIARSGQLGFYPNDALVPGMGNVTYNNNNGAIWVLVTRTDDRCP